VNLVDELKNLDVNNVSRWPLTFAFSVEPDTTSDSGVMTITVETPAGFISTHFISVIDLTRPATEAPFGGRSFFLETLV
jgi:hypothetical protein